MAAALLDDLLDPRVELVAARENELRLRGRCDIVRTWLVLVRVGVRPQDLMDVDRVPADGACEVTELGRRRQDEGFGRRPVARAAAAGARDQQQAGNAQDAKRRHAMTVLGNETEYQSQERKPLCPLHATPGLGTASFSPLRTKLYP